MYLEIIRQFSENRPGGLKKLAADVGMSEQNLHRCIRNNKIQADDLERIAIALNVDIRRFFDDEATMPLTNNTATAHGDSSIAAINSEVNIDKSKTVMLEERVSFLERLLAEKERLITVLMEKK